MKLAFIYNHSSSFIRQDAEILARHFQVEEVNYIGPSDIPRIARAIWRSDVTFSWFASGHSFLAVLFSILFKKKSVIVAGGYDVAFAPEINYGQYTQGLQKRMYSDFVLKNADIILAVSEFTKSELLSRQRPKRVEIVYNGIDTDKFKPEGKKEELVMTVASGLGNVIKLKGIDSFLKAANYLPDKKFLILGLSDHDKETIHSQNSIGNLEIHGRVSHKELIGYYQRAKVYSQLSYRESFGIALAEAMACGCIPVVTARGAMPEVVGDTGYYVPYGDEKATADGIRDALKSDIGALARKRIEDNFSAKKREKALAEAIGELMI